MENQSLSPLTTPNDFAADLHTFIYKIARWENLSQVETDSGVKRSRLRKIFNYDRGENDPVLYLSHVEVTALIEAAAHEIRGDRRLPVEQRKYWYERLHKLLIEKDIFAILFTNQKGELLPPEYTPHHNQVVLENLAKLSRADKEKIHNLVDLYYQMGIDEAKDSEPTWMILPLAKSQEKYAEESRLHSFLPPPTPEDAPGLYPDSAHSKAIAKEFNLLAITRGIYWIEIEPERDLFAFTLADRQVLFAQENHMTIRAQPLVFPAMLPDWLLRGNFSRDELSRVLYNHIVRIVERYKGEIKEWVVVKAPYIFPYRQNDIFYKTIGPEYIEIAFQAARNTDPSSHLIYSDVDNLESNGKTTQVTRHIIDMLKSKKLVDALEVDAYLDAARPPSKRDIATTLENYGIPIYVNIRGVNMQNTSSTPEELWEKKANIYKEVCKALLEFKMIKGWNLPSRDLFDENSQPTPVYEAISDVFTQLILKE